MDYFHSPVSRLLKGPLLHTPQGMVVLATGAVGLAGAIAWGLFELGPALGKSAGQLTVMCLGWPIIIFLLFVKNGAPGFHPSWRQTMYLLVGALGLPVYLWWHST
ncbi:MAG: hypothetical protein REI94_13875 [Moraxellaceae bacterium]|nr:hypothetical protein [Moraxellaceae bacterium]